jgi:hypothetical protein
MATNGTDLVDMRDDDVYPPICVQKIFGDLISYQNCGKVCAMSIGKVGSRK